MSVLQEDVEKTGVLAKLSLRLEEKEIFSRQFSRTIDYFEKLKELDLDDVKPLSHAVDRKNVMKNDERRDCLLVSEVLINAPAARRKTFEVVR